MVVLFLAAISLIVFFVAFGYFLSGPKYSGPITDHFDGKKFFTPGGKPAQGFGGVFKWMVKRQRGPWKALEARPFGKKPEPLVASGVHITFVNHSTFLIQANGVNILTDPVWSERTSPFQWAGPKRMRPPGIRMEDLPRIDLILLSHNHYDHLDLNTLKRLHKRDGPKIITPLGVKSFLDKRNITGATDLDWWQRTVLHDGLEIEAVPAQHFSGRGTFDRDATLWCGYVIRSAGSNIYFVGDTGYHESMFKEIGERCSPIEVALIPIGAFKPEWFMSPIHCSPTEAVRIHQEIKTRRSIATHFGTFPLADDGLEEPVTELRKSLDAEGLSHDHFLALEEGELLKIS